MNLIISLCHNDVISNFQVSQRADSAEKRLRETTQLLEEANQRAQNAESAGRDFERRACKRQGRGALDSSERRDRVHRT